MAVNHRHNAMNVVPHNLFSVITPGLYLQGNPPQTALVCVLLLFPLRKLTAGVNLFVIPDACESLFFSFFSFFFKEVLLTWLC